MFSMLIARGQQPTSICEIILKNWESLMGLDIDRTAAALLAKKILSLKDLDDIMELAAKRERKVNLLVKLTSRITSSNMQDLLNVLKNIGEKDIYDNFKEQCRKLF